MRCLWRARLSGLQIPAPCGPLHTAVTQFWCSLSPAGTLGPSCCLASFTPACRTLVAPVLACWAHVMEQRTAALCSFRLVTPRTEGLQAWFTKHIVTLSRCHVVTANTSCGENDRALSSHRSGVHRNSEVKALGVLPSCLSRSTRGQ